MGTRQLEQATVLSASLSVPLGMMIGRAPVHCSYRPWTLWKEPPEVLRDSRSVDEGCCPGLLSVPSQQPHRCPLGFCKTTAKWLMQLPTATFHLGNGHSEQMFPIFCSWQLGPLLEPRKLQVSCLSGQVLPLDHTASFLLRLPYSRPLWISRPFFPPGSNIN